VLFTLPSSRARLVQLADAFGELRSFNAAIIAVPMNGEEKILSRIGASPRILFPVATEGAADIVSTYGLFRRTLAPEGARPDPPMPTHMEFLIDRSGYLRARWIPGGDRPGWSDIKTLVAESSLNQSAPRCRPTSTCTDELWRAVLLLNLALAVGVVLGWLAWGREVSD
jgi:putative copper resistance protein D